PRARGRPSFETSVVTCSPRPSSTFAGDRALGLLRLAVATPDRADDSRAQTDRKEALRHRDSARRDLPARGRGLAGAVATRAGRAPRRAHVDAEPAGELGLAGLQIGDVDGLVVAEEGDPARAVRLAAACVVRLAHHAAARLAGHLAAEVRLRRTAPLTGSLARHGGAHRRRAAAAAAA